MSGQSLLLAFALFAVPITWNPTDKAAELALTNNNRTATHDNSGVWATVRTTAGKSSGKWYMEVHVDSASPYDLMISLADASAALNNFPGSDTHGYSYSAVNGLKYTAGAGTAFGATFANGDVIGEAWDADNRKLFFAKNNVWQGSGDPVAGTNPAFSSIPAGVWFPAISAFDANDAITANFKTANLTYSPPTGYTAIGD